METFAEWLRQRRDGLGLTRKELAGRVGCSVSTLRKIEDGERRPSGQVAELLANCLDIAPGERSTFLRVARGELSVDRLRPQEAPSPAPTVSPPRSNLPVFPTPLIGRERELDQLTQLLADPQCRLLTLTGPGGIGKTRLAVEISSSVQHDFDHGVYFVPLATVGSIQAVISTTANALHFGFHGPGDPKAQLLNYLKGKQALLIVDNVEHLLAGEPDQETLAELLVEILQQAAQVKLLITSREALELQDEWIFEVEGLPVPDSIAAEGRAQSTSVELFMQRARRAHVEFSATSEDFPAILRICHLVGGMPLAIELAATWVRTLSCDEIAREIERGLDILSVSTHDRPTRHRSMHAVFDHSWKLLTEGEKQVLARLSVFRGGFRREAAEQVAGATLAVLSTLVTKSFIRRSGAGRYDLHELIGQFAADHLARRPEDQTAPQASHGKYYLAYFAQADGRLQSAAQVQTLADLTLEIDNFRAAWDWAVAGDEFGLIEKTMRVFAALFDMRGWLQEGLDMLGRAVGALQTAHGQLPADRTNQLALGRIMATRAALATRLGQLKQAQATFEGSLEILRPLNEPRVLVEAITFLGIVREFAGDYPEASKLYSEGLDIATSIGDRWFAALCRLMLAGEGSLRLPGARPEDSFQRLQSVVSDWRQIGDPRLTAVALQNLSWMAVQLGRLDEARAALEESIVLNTSIGEHWNMGFSYRGLGLVAQSRGEHREAVEVFRKSRDLFRDIGAHQDVARVLVEMSQSMFALGYRDEAEAGWREALHVTMETQGTFVGLEALTGIAALRAKQGEADKALELLLIVLDHPSSLQETKNRALALNAEVEAQLAPAQIEAIRARAGGKTLEAVVEDLLKQ